MLHALITHCDNYRYDERTWSRWFDNEVQYFNRVQRPEWTSV